MEKNALGKLNDYTPLVSIVIPAYKAANYLAEAIESALGQTYKNVEVIVVNDGSPDDGATRQVALRYGDKIRYFEKPNGGSSSALNYGIKMMRGEWFSWLSHDDLYYPEKVEKQIEYLNSLNIPDSEIADHVFFAASELIDGDRKLIRRPSAQSVEVCAKRVNQITSNAYLIAEPTENNFHGCSCLVHRRAFENVGMFDEALRLLNDIDMWYRLYANDYHVHFIPKVLVKGRVHSKQISRSIGFSYHNPEQDMFWNRSLDWLKKNASDNYDVFFMFGKNAYRKTRNAEGDKAFAIAADICPMQKRLLMLQRILYRMMGRLRSTAKKIYLLIGCK